ncbi:hypothetical protein OE699_11715 [Sedimentimonas flavescens]|uniref:Uncharacterized protein n=1 Tax=Sedimentimonas flavescens TaxID=2851012 RepID=A0ABT3A0Q4_9RHOB|nr:hypothetical protein [Sedimentimonas flavescens]MCV2879516.1 hypothetical protein [Sedimentimonas flavescens]
MALAQAHHPRPTASRKLRGFAVRALSARLVPMVLLLSLFLSGIVPQGMMRVGDADSTRLVLCTPEGPRDIWMRADGSVSDQAPLPDENHEVSKCLAVTLALAAVQDAALAAHSPASFAPFVPDLAVSRPIVAAEWRPAQPRAPPLA